MYITCEQGTVALQGELFNEGLHLVRSAYQNVELMGRSPEFARDEQFAKYEGNVTTSWFQNPYFQGSYSCYGATLGEKFAETVEYKGESVKKIFAPAHDVLFFIGEHASLIPEVGTMEGAVESGERIARLF